MRIITAAEIEECMTFRNLVKALRAAFRADVIPKGLKNDSSDRFCLIFG